MQSDYIELTILILGLTMFLLAFFGKKEMHILYLVLGFLFSAIHWKYF